jgi:hypothetical protein
MLLKRQESADSDSHSDRLPHKNRILMRIVIHPAARREFDHKVGYFRRRGLLFNSAELFIDEIERGLREILENPGKRRMPGAPGYFRVGPTERFSFSLIYQITETDIEVIAISAPQRHPGYWKRRKS